MVERHRLKNVQVDKCGAKSSGNGGFDALGAITRATKTRFLVEGAWRAAAVFAVVYAFAAEGE
jgi:hypothetical protein